MSCPLCQFPGPFEAWEHLFSKDRRFWHCPTCDAVFVDPGDRAPASRERERYLTHQNDLGARGFADFLGRTVTEIKNRKPPGTRILDFGSGPEPSMSLLLEREGFEVVGYDPFFKPEPPQGVFDLILLHEVFEHLYEPGRELEGLRRWLRPGGTVLIRTELRPDRDGFARWWYARDFTHVFFASAVTVGWIGKALQWRAQFWSPQLWCFETASD